MVLTGPYQEFEAAHVFPRVGRVLIVGSHEYEASRPSRRAMFPPELTVGIDMVPGPGVDRVLDLEEPLPPDLPKFAHVDCLSVLEHSRRPWLLAANIERLMKSKATLYLSAPFVWRVHAYPDDYFRFTLAGVRSLFTCIEWDIVTYVSTKLHTDKVPAYTIDDHVYMARTEVLAFGRKRST